ncbi:acetylxylan esterase [Micromonospora inyonensis]|uniref:Cephalosporin-C deacetylase n=1 Tax=Micromonospora inyonensis TaxID=47866 RepID=A0A1C6SI08_9ACTN|nr:acetylxylan esterase [Micromonospora inyonensis]SCL28988.1 cephalosporin-C deacetylase [Micromonospora inyonensis]
MPLTDLSLAELTGYRPVRREPADFDEFWADTLAAAARHELDATFEPVDSPLRVITVHDVTFSGFGGDRVKAWLAVPAGTEEPLPCVVEFPGYGGGRGLPHENLLYAASGYAHLFMDVRGQGSGWSAGATPDREPDGGNPQHPGFVTRGVLDPRTLYYRRVVTDAVRAVQAARAHPLVDPDQVVATGISQGGGLSLAVAALDPRLRAVAPDVPFLCDFRRGAELATAGPYQEIVNYLKVHRGNVERVFDTLSYVDGVNFATRGRCPALFSVALMDASCPASTVFGAYHHYAGPSRIEVYPFNGHEGGESVQDEVRLRFFAEVLAAGGGPRPACRQPGDR